MNWLWLKETSKRNTGGPKCLQTQAGLPQEPFPECSSSWYEWSIAHSLHNRIKSHNSFPIRNLLIIVVFLSDAFCSPKKKIFAVSSIYFPIHYSVHIFCLLLKSEICSHLWRLWNDQTIFLRQHASLLVLECWNNKFVYQLAIMNNNAT